MSASAVVKFPSPEVAPVMNCTIERDTLSAALRQAGDVFGAKSASIPILSHVLLSATEGSLAVRACNGDQDITITVKADVRDQGDVCLSGQALRALVDGWPKGAAVSLKADPDGRRCTVSSGRSRYALPSLDSRDLASLGSMGEEDTSFKLPVETLSAAFTAVSWAMQEDVNAAPYLCGVFCHTEGPNLVFVAADGKVLARLETPRPDGMGDLSGVIIPDRALPTLHKLCDAGDAILLQSDGRRLSAQVGNVSFVTKLVEGQYVAYQRVVPPACEDRCAVVDRADILAAMARLETVQDKDTIVKLTASDQGLTIVNRLSQSGDGAETMDAEIAGDFACAVSRRQIVPAFKAFQGDLVRIEQSAAGRPVRIVGPSPKDDGLVAVLMPSLVA
jgi:DNA polymerase-3 subunit beta